VLILTKKIENSKKIETKEISDDELIAEAEKTIKEAKKLFFLF